MTIIRLATTTALSALLLSFPAAARDQTDGKSEDLAVEKMICQQLYVHTPATDVVYQPGTDIDGNAVTPADLPVQGGQIGAPDYIEVPLTVDLAQRLNQPAPTGVELEGVIGNLRLYKDGRISYNGQDILPQASTMCGDELKVQTSTEAAAPTETYTIDTPLSGSTAPSSTSNPPPEPKPGSKAAVPTVGTTAHFPGQRG